VIVLLEFQDVLKSNINVYSFGVSFDSFVNVGVLLFESVANKWITVLLVYFVVLYSVCVSILVFY